jgi:3-methyladenine DNA glycosylase AlkD
LKNTENINNWDLVDLSAPQILGDFLQKEGTEILIHLAKSPNVWERRIAIISTYPLIKKRRFGETLAISELLLTDEHDLIHKAVGWMLREIGKRNKKVLELFLMQRYHKMPRVMLRYAIEKFPEDERKKWLIKN